MFQKKIVAQNTLTMNGAVIGMGSTGAIVRAFIKFGEKPEQTVAIKLFNRPDLQVYELMAMQMLGPQAHEHNCVELLANGIEPLPLGQFYLVFKLYSEDLHTFIDKNSKEPITSLSNSQCVARNILRALEFTHSRGIVHCDVKAENIFVETSNPLHVVLGDFGLAKNTSDLARSMSGCSQWHAPPELATQNPLFIVNTSIDLWSLGVTLYMVATAKLLVNSESWFHHELTIKINIGQLSKNSPDETLQFQEIFALSNPKFATSSDSPSPLMPTAENFFQFLCTLLMWDPKERSTPQEALTHLFVQNPIRKD